MGPSEAASLFLPSLPLRSLLVGRSQERMTRTRGEFAGPRVTRKSLSRGCLRALLGQFRGIFGYTMLSYTICATVR